MLDAVVRQFKHHWESHFISTKLLVLIIKRDFYVRNLRIFKFSNYLLSWCNEWILGTFCIKLQLLLIVFIVLSWETIDLRNPALSSAIACNHVLFQGTIGRFRFKVQVDELKDHVQTSWYQWEDNHTIIDAYSKFGSLFFL